MKYEILISPCSTNERLWDRENAIDIYKRIKDSKVFTGDSFIGVELFEFRTYAEAQAFLKGYNAAVGWNGDGGFHMRSVLDGDIVMVCKECGSESVMKDAWAEWGYNEQTWILHSTYDNSYCNKCECETKIIEKTIENEKIKES